MAELFENRKQIEDLIQQADDNDETKSLIKYFENIKKERNPYFLTSNELENILKWKLRTQYGRQSKIRRKNSAQNIELITKMAFSINHEDINIENTLRLNALKLLYGVETAVASAILTLSYPHKYCVIDFRNWRQLFNPNSNKTTYSANDYNEYLNKIKYLSNKFNLTPQQIDMAIWQKDINENN